MIGLYAVPRVVKAQVWFLADHLCRCWQLGRVSETRSTPVLVVTQAPTMRICPVHWGGMVQVGPGHWAKPIQTDFAAGCAEC